MTAIRRLWGHEIEVASAPYGLDPELVTAIIKVESDGQAHAYRYEPGFFRRYLSHLAEYKDANPRRVAASYGLMQIMYSTAVECGYEGPPEGLFVPETNLEYGCMYLSRLLKWSKGDVPKAVAAYNGGRGCYGEPGPQRYAAKVMALLGGEK